MKNRNIDMVIPTLDGKMLFQTINSINSGIVKPKKFIVFILMIYKEINLKNFKTLNS